MMFRGAEAVVEKIKWHDFKVGNCLHINPKSQD